MLRGQYPYIFCILLFTNFLVNSEGSCLHELTYKDKHTGRNECCSEICEDANLKRTEKQCEEKCQGYPSATEKQPAPGASKSTKDNSGFSPTLAIVMSLVGIFVLPVAVVFGAVLFHSRRNRTPQADVESLPLRQPNNVTPTVATPVGTPINESGQDQSNHIQ